VNKDLCAVFVGLVIIGSLFFGSTMIQSSIDTDKIIETCKESK
jgi:hypothetical protein